MIVFLTEIPYCGKFDLTHDNMRTEFAWMCSLDAYHSNIHKYKDITNYDHVFIIFPKGKTFLSAEGIKLLNNINPISDLLNTNFIDVLKANNKNVYYIQEGPSWWFNDYEIHDQINFIKLLNSVDIIFAHNEYDVKFYKGWFPNKKIETIPTLMIENSLKDIKWNPENKTIIGGNFSKWYGGIQSYRVAMEFLTDTWTMTSHSTRENEHLLNGLHHLPRMLWTDWMRQLSTFKYAVHLMPTIAAGTFSLNCAYFGIPCIGNKNVDTQRICHPELSVDVNDMESAVKLAIRLKNDLNFYNECSSIAIDNYRKYYNVSVWKDKFNKILI